tara:strand:- start:93790 stop:94665 length:876 start_codon:yes stop_codon:yes gene_type:complete
MRTNNLEILSSQLDAALEDVWSGEGEPLEIAVLAGLLARYEGVTPKPLETAITWRDGVGSELLDAALARTNGQAFVDRVTAIEEEYPQEEKLDVLFDFDEYCAAAHFCLADQVAEGPADLIARFVTAFPEPWEALTETASTLLATTPPLAGDPARRVWEAVEATTWERSEHRAPLYSDGLDAAGFMVSFSLAAMRPPAYMEQARAAGELPEAPLWQTVRKADGWELALTVDEGHELVFQLHCAEELLAVVQFGDKSLELKTVRPGVLTCKALPGDYSWTVGDVSFKLRVEP